MSYTVSCPSCSTSFPVDPAKVPEEGVLAQCSMCPEVFEVTRPDDADLAPAAEVDTEVAPEPVIEEPTVEEAPVVEAASDAEELVFETSDGGGMDSAVSAVEEVEEVAEVDEAVPEHAFGDQEIAFDEPLVAPEEEALEAEAPAVEPEPALEEPVAEAEPEPAAPSPGPVQFGKRDPSDKAKSLARSLVSDILAYYKDKHVQSLAAGTLVPDFDEEVEKSWKEYTDQVDDEILANNTFFNDALNEILAEGQSVFTLEG